MSCDPLLLCFPSKHWNHIPCLYLPLPLHIHISPEPPQQQWSLQQQSTKGLLLPKAAKSLNASGSKDGNVGLIFHADILWPSLVFSPVIINAVGWFAPLVLYRCTEQGGIFKGEVVEVIDPCLRHYLFNTGQRIFSKPETQHSCVHTLKFSFALKQSDQTQSIFWEGFLASADLQIWEAASCGLSCDR